ncbi:hypothetical protein [Arsenicicoccus dermatophilus]|uniref:hypothetical protein n=1 Tax=Arsenicicoccus dermatophilus TaxID=1076331 RepID=UPI003916E44D
MTLAGIPASRPRVFLAGMFLLVLALDAVTAITSAADWWGWFPTAIHTIQNFNQPADIAVAVAAAVLAGTTRRYGLGPWGATAARGRAPQLGAVVAAAVLPALVAHCLMGTVVLCLAIHRGGWAGAGWWAILAVATGPALSALWAVIGCALGLHVPRAIATALAAIAPFALCAVLDIYLTDSPAGVLTYASSGTFSDVRPTHTTLGARLVATTAVMAWAWTVLARRRARTRSACATAASLALAVAFVAGYSFTDIPGAGDQQCSGTAPRICLPVRVAAARTSYTAMITPAWNELPGPLRRATINADGEPQPNAINTSITDGVNAASLLPERLASIAALGQAAWPEPTGCTPTPADAHAPLVFQIWWQQRFAIPTDGSGPMGTNLQAAPDYPQASKEAQHLNQMTTRQRDTWVSQRIGHAHQTAPGKPCPPITTIKP